jgi:hypothetical protein
MSRGKDARTKTVAREVRIPVWRTSRHQWQATTYADAIQTAVSVKCAGSGDRECRGPREPSNDIRVAAKDTGEWKTNSAEREPTWR